MIRLFYAHVFCGLATAAAFACATPAKAAMLAADNAGNYDNTTNPWVNGSNGGTGFNAWDLSSNNNNGNTLFSGYFLGDSTAGSGNINTGGQSFAIYANPNGAFANASRAFTGGALTLGQTFSIQLAVNFRNGDKGINLLAGGTQFFNFDIGTSGTATDGYYYKNGTDASVNTGFGYDSASVFTLTYLQQTATTGTITITRASDSAMFSETINSSGFDSVTLYNSNTDNGNAANNLYFNNLSVVPEPSTYVCAAIGLGGLIVFQRRKRRAL